METALPVLNSPAVRWSRWIMLGALLAGLSVALGAIAAHGIDHFLAEQYDAQTRTIAGETVPAAATYLDDFKTASRYQMSHALGLMLIGLLKSFRPARLLNGAGVFLLLGILLFCGSLYVLALSAHSLEDGARHALGLTAACGGTSLILGWVLLAACVCCGGGRAPTQ
jgi:uncharacterized membrane protein YgdD (TMEM256/DUF423 family)